MAMISHHNSKITFDFDVKLQQSVKIARGMVNFAAK